MSVPSLKVVLSLVVFTAAGFAQTANPAPKLTAAEIVDRNIAARGGRPAWHNLQTIAMSGQLEAGGNNRTTAPVANQRPGTNQAPAQRPAEQIRLPFRMEMARGRRLRIEVDFRHDTAVQLFDGAAGWKLRPFLNRREVEPYTDDESRSIATQSELDGPLVDYTRKGTRIDLEATDTIEGRNAYRLKLTLKNGASFHLWIDAATFLETRMEGTPRRLDGVYRPVEIYYRDFRTVGGLKLPFVLETRVVGPAPKAGVPPVIISTEQIRIDKIDLNPKLPDARFTKADLLAAAATPPAPPTQTAMQTNDTH